MLTEAQRVYRAECRREARERFDREYDGGSERAAAAPRVAEEPPSRDDLAIEAQARAEWQRSPAIRAEFVELERYVAFAKADARGLVRILSRKA